MFFSADKMVSTIKSWQVFEGVKQTVHCPSSVGWLWSEFLFSTRAKMMPHRSTMMTTGRDFFADKFTINGLLILWIIRFFLDINFLNSDDRFGYPSNE